MPEGVVWMSGVVTRIANAVGHSPHQLGQLGAPLGDKPVDLLTKIPALHVFQARHHLHGRSCSRDRLLPELGVEGSLRFTVAAAHGLRNYGGIVADELRFGELPASETEVIWHPI